MTRLVDLAARNAVEKKRQFYKEDKRKLIQIFTKILIFVTLRIVVIIVKI